ncbi:MAG: hypothetical protein NTY76_07995 [Candidatus Omnitrophica bacterium]|nr:hypothetical protein [Candidatus Omnitrophota bacterium]
MGNQNTGATQSEVDKKNDLDSSKTKAPDVQVCENKPGTIPNGIKKVSYDEHGKITELTMDDGTIVAYKYSSDKELTLESKQDGVAVKFKNTSTAGTKDGQGSESTANVSSASGNANIAGSADSGEGKGGIIVEVYAKEPSVAESFGRPGNRKTDMLEPAFQVGCPDTTVPIAKLAATPMKFDFKEIKKAIEKTSKIRAQALKDYKHNTSNYYDAMDAAIKNNIDALEKENIGLNGLEGRVPAANRQDAVEMTVNNMYAYIRNGGADRSIKDIMSLEGELRSKIVNPGRKVYEGRLIEATEYTNDMIEKLVKSQLALYLKIKKDKIDVIINLQKTPKPNK